MPNQHQNLWATTPGMHERCLALRDAGHGPTPIGRMLTKEFGVRVTNSNVESHLKRNAPLVDAGKGAMVPRDLIEPKAGFAEPFIAPKPKHPQGWEPHVEERGDEATAVSEPTDNPNPDEEWLINSWNFDPKEWMIVGPINCRRWQGTIPVESAAACKCAPKMEERHYEHPWMFYYKASLVRRDKHGRAADLKELLPSILRIKPRTVSPPSGDIAFGVAVSDIQMGKGDQDGVPGTVQRFIDRIGMVQDRVRDLRKIGVPIGPLYVFGLGDLIEQCDSNWYPQQTFTAQLNLRDQLKVTRRLIVQALKEWAPGFERVVVACVGGNHGEARSDGKSRTDFADNHDVALWEMAEETLAENKDAFSHVSFVIPNGDLNITLDVCGTVTGLAHGHQAGRGNGAAMKIQNWWKDQAHGNQPIGQAQLLLTGHYHHLLCTQSGSKTHLQCPALEGGSNWWKELTGQDAPKGMLTATIGKACGPAGWNDLKVL